MGFLDDVAQEFVHAQQQHKPLNSLHEAYAVILEELDEFWDEVRKKAEDRDPELVYWELVQVAAMAWRTADNVLRRGIL